MNFFINLWYKLGNLLCRNNIHKYIKTGKDYNVIINGLHPDRYNCTRKNCNRVILKSPNINKKYEDRTDLESYRRQENSRELGYIQNMDEGF